MDARASMVTEVILWLAVMSVVFIGVWWFFSNFSYQKPEMERLESDIAKIQSMANEACSHYSYNYKYNPLTEAGKLTVNDSNICISSGKLAKCRLVVCGPLVKRDLALENASDLLVSRENGGSIGIYG
ncbi:MAG TPA: hypothetical protein HA254_04315 [Candidatus Diapherotrites archaeon]|uniref:Class III signal peptide-containing protein n=1 Tax=Candidatus Iainarchaeum sp. TaxID=3101447 RepID=A0A7J4IWP2_9ARCH|nr:hypothetical protein [Candidatus Diapherotrites archaeon]